MKLLKVDTVNEARSKLTECCARMMPRIETRGLLDAAGCILAEDIYSKENIPPYRRSIMDGYAVRSKDLGAAGDMIPTSLKVTGEVLLGTDSSKLSVESGCCVYVPTGGEVPEGADAVVMVEYCEPFGEDMLAVSKSASPGENVVQAGEDVAEGGILLSKGRKLRSQDIGVLAAAGVTAVPVFVPWRVAVISTGDELVSPEETPGPGQIRDINSYTISARSTEEGFTVMRTLSVKDDSEAIAAALETAKDDSDLVVISGGSSQGKKDMTAALIDKAADHGVLTHGIAAKPGKPTITGFDRASKTLFIGLPGHPAAALMVYEQLVISLWRCMTGREPMRTVKARVTVNTPSAPGRKTFQLVKLAGDEAEPVFARSGMLSPMSAADGYFIMDENQEGVKAGEAVEVFLWE
ncbi:MAG: molybdopterin molybdotransferase MoeA [Clostridiales bacterium]|nr:molybdopterin molybdotransferase MoeA [Clostridiales bacterium]